MKRALRRGTPRKPRRAPRSTHPAASAPPAVTEPDPLADQRIRPLLDRYCRLAGVKQAARGPDHSELRLPEAERPFFRDRKSLLVAFSVAALERAPDAEIAVLGSPFVSQLIEAIRARAARRRLGLVASASAAVQESSEGALSDRPTVGLSLPVRGGVAKLRSQRVAVHPVGRLVARVVLRAGTGVEEAVVESDVFDLSAGAKASDDVAAAFRELEAGQAQPADPSAAAHATPVPARPAADLLRLLLSHLRERSVERVTARRQAAEQELAVELARLDRYFESILKEQTEAASLETVTALAERRRAEEIRRSQVKAVVHPLQLIEATVLIERAEWQLESERGRRAELSAQRSLTGSADWIITCPHCGRPPASLLICRHDHGACDSCSSRCSVCAEDFCTEHGIAECRVDGQPACDEHVRVCASCRLQHCTTHAGVCAEDGHAACTPCLAPCGSCGRVVCNRHAEQSDAAAPKGSRRLCTACLRHCEGGSNEPVGVDEVAACASCGKSVCTAHLAVCVVDEQVHCSQHLRRTDRSRRLVCGKHRAACGAEEPTALFASDEVQACPVCGKDSCRDHRAACSHCGRQVCTADLGRESGHCTTCAQLAAVRELPDTLATAALTATGRRRSSSRRWRVARDRSHVVVEVDLGLTRRAVFTVRHGDSAPDGVVRHSLLGSKRGK